MSISNQMPTNNPRLFRPRSSANSDDGSSSQDNTIGEDRTSFPSDSSDGLSIIQPDEADDALTNVNLKMLNAYGTSSGCASNDAGNDYLTPCTYSTPQPAFLSCIADNENELMFDYDATATTVEFDYELHTPTTGNGEEVNMVEVIDEFQNGLAGEIAADYGVYCGHSSQRALGKEFVQETDDENIGGGGMYAPVCLGVSSSPSDTVDDFVTQCIIDVNLDQPSKCTPMKGYLTLYARSRRRLSTSSTLDSIQSYIEERSSTYLSENILAVSYIGKRESVGVGIINPELLSRPQFGGRRRRSLVQRTRDGDYDGDNYVCGALALGLVGVALLAFRRLRKQPESC